MERHFFMISRALNARKRKIFALFFALAASIGLSYALTPKGTDVWDDATKTLTVNSNPEDYAYWGESDIENLVISDAVTSIGVSAFEECSALTSVTIGNSVTSIGTSAFSSCYLLTSVEIPNSVEEIGVQAFASCSELTSVTIGNGVTSIGDYAFVDCSGLETVTINAESLESYGTDAFEGTAEDLTIYVPAGSVDTYKAGWAAYANKIEAIGSDEPAAPAATEVTITNNDFPGMDVSFTKDGVTVSADWIDNMQSGNLVAPGSFSTTLGNFTKIEVNAGEIGSLGEGWSGNSERQTWTGNASSVSFSGDISGLGHGITIMCTIEAAAPAEPVDPTEGIEVPEGGEIFVLTDSIMTREEGAFMFAYDGEGWVTECQYMVWHTQTMNAESRWNRTTMNMVGTDGPEFGSNKANVVRLEINFASTTGGGALAEGWSLSGNKYIWTGSSKSVRFYHTGATISGITSVVYVFDGKCHRDPQRFTTSVLAEDLIVGDTLAMGAQLISEVYGGFYLDANRVRYHGVVQTQNFRSTFSQLGAVSKHGAMDNEYPENRGCLEPINENGELGEEWIVISLDPLHIAGIGTASAVTNTCYTSEVDYAALEPGDTLAYGASIINTPEKVWFRANRMQRSNSGETFIIEDDRYMEGSYGTFGKNGVITDKYGTTFAPINEQGTLGGKWVVVFYSPLTIAGIGEPAIELTLSKDVSIIGLPIAGINDIGNNNYEVEPGTQFQIQADPAPAHYSFVGWSDLASTDPNYSANPRTIVADKNLTIEPIFAIDTYIVTLASNDETMGTLRVEGAGGSNIGPKEEINIYHGVVGEHYQVLGEYSGSSWIGVGGNDNKTITVESLNGEIIDNITLEVYMPSHWTGYSIAATSGNVSGDVANYQDLVITNINATSVTLSRVGEGENGGSVLFSEIIVNGRDAQQGGQAEPTTVTWNSADMPSSGNANSFTLDGVTITCGGIGIDWGWKDFQGNGTFTTDLGNFTKIEVTTEYCEMAGDGWSGVSNKMTWTGNAASVSYNGSIMGCLSIVFTIEPTAAPAASGIVDNGDGTYTVDYGTELTFVAKPAEGFMLDSWSNGAEVTSDTLKLTMTEELSLTANFKHIPAVITLPEGVSIVGMPIEGITSKGEGVYEVEYGTEFQISADIIPEHYHFGHWADLDAEDAMYAINPRTIVAGEDLTVEPIFAIDTYTLTLASNDETMGIVSVEGAGQGDEPEPFAQLIVPESWSSEVGVTITADDLPGFVASTEEAVKALPVPTEGSVFVIYNFREEVDPSGGAGNASVEAVTFENGEYVRTTSSPVDHANASYYSNQGMIFLYTTAAGQAGQGGEGEEPKGIVDNGDGTYTVDRGTELTFVAKAADGYHVQSWSNGAEVNDLVEATQTITMTEALDLSALFAENPIITLATNDSTMGIVTLAGAGKQLTVAGSNMDVNQNIPIRPVSSTDTRTMNQSIYPVAMLTGIAGNSISGMTYYISEPGAHVLTATYVVKLMETEQAAFSDAVAVNTESATTVYTGTIDVTGNTLDIVFDQPYAYNGGNLLVEFSISSASHQNALAKFSVFASQGGSFQQYYNFGFEEMRYYTYDFLAKTTFICGDNKGIPGVIDLGNGQYNVLPGTELTFVAQPAERFMLDSWSNGAPVNGDSLTLTVTEPLSLTANFKYIPAVITLPEGVNIVEPMPEGITDKGEGVYEVEHGTEFQITAVGAPEHYHFDHWADLDEEDAMYVANPRTIVASENLTVEPFYAIDTYTLTLASNDETMGIVSVEGAGQGGLQEPSAQLIVPESWSSEVGVTITAADLPGFVASTEEAVKALPVPTEGSVFVIYNFREEVDPSGGAGNASVEAVTFENGEYVRTTSTRVDHANASYYSNQGMIFLYTTAAGQAGQGGEGEEPEGIVDNGDGTYTVDWGTELTFEAVPAKDYHLVSWSNGAEVTEDNKQTLTITDELSLSAFFKHDTYILTVEGVEVKNAKFADGTADAEVLNPGTLVGVQTGDNVQLTTTATFSSAAVGDNLTITVHYAIEVIDGGIYDNEYALAITDSILEIKGAIIEPMTPDKDAAPEDQEAEVKEGFEIYAYGYCYDSGYDINYYLKSGQPDQYKIDFEDESFVDVAYDDTSISGREGSIHIDIPANLETGDYSMTITFRDSRYGLESDPITVSFHVNLPETYVVALFDNVMAIVDTCECLTDIQWYWRADASQTWQAIEGATGYYYKMEGGLSGEFFIKAKKDGIDTYTCPQDDLSLYGETSQAAVRAYPNPVRNNTTVTIEGSDALQHSLRVVNLMGNTMMNGSFEGNTTTVEMGAYPQGNYMISVDGITVKVIKQ